MFQVKKIGKVISFILLLQVSAKAETLSLKLSVMDSNDAKVKEVQQGGPFTLEVELSGHVDGVSMPEISNLQDFAVLDKSLTRSVHLEINGTKRNTKVFHFQVQPKKLGHFSLGPAHVKINKKFIKSNKVEVRVVKKKKEHEGEPSLKLETTKTHVYPGQPFLCSLKFYYAQDVSLDAVSQPELDAFYTQKMEGPFSAKDKQGRSFVEWYTTLIPKKSGVVKIDPVVASYKMQRPLSHRSVHQGINLLSQFFSTVDRRQISSNYLEITVKDLPATKGKVDGIGLVDKVDALVEPSVAYSGEGVVYKVVVHAQDNNTQLINFPKLELPAGLKYYESKTYVQPDDGNPKKSVKVFEYIIQAQEKGNYIIPQQHLRYFNYQTERYHDIGTNEVSLQIKQYDKTDKQQPAVGNHLDQQQTVYQNASDDKDGQIQALPTYLKLNSSWGYTRQMPFYLWFLLLVFPWAILAMDIVLKNMLKKLAQHKLIRKKRIFMHARKRLNVLKKRGDVQSIRQIFFDICQECTGIKEVDTDKLYAWSAHVLDDSEKIADFHAFVEKLLAYSFSEQKRDEGELLFIEAKKWLDALEELLP